MRKLKEIMELGRVIKETSSLIKTEIVSYDELGRVACRWDKAGNKTVFTYDDRSRLKNEPNDRKTISQNNQSTVIVYDKSGKIISKTEGGKTIYYEYDGNGNIIKFIDQNGNNTGYKEIDFRGNIKEVYYNGNLITKYEYYDYGSIKKKTSSESIIDGYFYNRFTLLEKHEQYVRDTLKKKYEYEYDDNGNQVKKTETENGVERVTGYVYDELNRVKETEYPDGKKETFLFDGNGNIDFKSTYVNNKLILTEDYVHDSVNKLITKTEDDYVRNLRIYDFTMEEADWNTLDNDEAINIRVSYEDSNTTTAQAIGFKLIDETTLENGSNATGQAIIFEFDKETKSHNENMGIRKEELSEEKPKEAPEKVGVLRIKYEYHYDSNGNMITELVDEKVVKDYTYNSLNQLVTFSNKVNGTTSSYEYYPQGLRKDQYYYIYDAHGDVKELRGATGVIIVAYDYDIYGEEKDTGLLSQNNVYNPIRYSGQFFDEESGLYYLRARYYSPEIMRFISEDTYKGSLENTLTLNYYAYCWGNPVMFY